jgi:antirestriction protein ArdC
MHPQYANDKPPPRDYRQEVTDDIIRLLEAGTAPWQKPWEEVAGGGLPYNPTTNKPYRGGNIIALMISEMRHGYTDPRWMTYKQAADKGWQVRKGEKSTRIEFWEAKPGDENGQDDERPSRLIHRVYSVFNAQQIDVIPHIVTNPREPWEVCEAGERIMKDSGADIRYGGNRAYYRHDTDHVQLPPREVFKDAPGFYGTATHELIHWTGGEKRLNRESLTTSKGFNAHDEQYAREELIAEIGSMMLGAETGIPHDPSQHAAYVQSWIEALKNDKNEIFRAASAASKACDFILDKNRSVETPAAEGPYAAAVSASRESTARAL